MTLTIGSLFSGVGGLDLGLERAGIGPVLWQCEIDPFCREVLAKHWPDARRFEDVAGLEPPDADLLCGGFPCTDISLAGKGAGIAEGTRSGMWSEYARIVGLVRPRYVVVENVSALLVRGMGRVLGDLAALGYDAWWDCIPAAAVGAPHRRDRLFVVAYRDDDGPQRHDTCGGVSRGGERTTGATSGPCSPVAHSHSHRRESEWSGCVLDRLREALRDNLDRCRREAMADSSGQRRGEGRPELAGRLGLAPLVERGCASELANALSHGPQRQQQTGATKGAIAGRAPQLADADSGQRHRREQDTGRGPERRAPASRSSQWPPRPDDLYAWGRLPTDAQPSICRVAHGIPNRVDRLKALGNAVVPAVAEIIGRAIMAAEQA